MMHSTRITGSGAGSILNEGGFFDSLWEVDQTIIMTNLSSYRNVAVIPVYGAKNDRVLAMVKY